MIPVINFKIKPNKLNPKQQENLEKLIHISDLFHSDAGIPYKKTDVHSERIIVLESGHQPLFFPYPGIWKKAFLLNIIQRQLNENNQDSAAIFGFADQNLSTAKLLSENKIPALNKQGSEIIGSKIQSQNRFKCFNHLKKPSREVWERDTDKIKKIYLDQIKNIGTSSLAFQDRINHIESILDDCYKRATNFADLNAFIFSRICQDFFHLNVNFFRFSDVQNERFFIDEWKIILGSLPEYRVVYNDTITKKGLNIVPLPPKFLPFWYHCSCGAKINLSAEDESDYKGFCSLCKNNYNFSLDGIKRSLYTMIQNMGMTGVARNVIFSEGLGTHVFISGVGGGMKYGQISNEIAKKLNFNVPISVSWRSRDYYLGVVHAIALRDAMKRYCVTIQNFNNGSIDGIIHKYKQNILKTMIDMTAKHENNRDLGRYRQLLAGAETNTEVLKNSFSIVPSMLDLIINCDSALIVKQWEKAVFNAESQELPDTFMLNSNVIYTHEDIDGIFLTEPDIIQIYNSIESIGVTQ